MLFVDTDASVNSERATGHLNEKKQVREPVTSAKTERRPEARVQLVWGAGMSPHPQSRLCLVQASDSGGGDQQVAEDGVSGLCHCWLWQALLRGC